MNDGVRLRTRTLLRTYRRSVVLLGVAAGLAAAVPIAACTVARRTDAALAGYLAHAGTPDVTLLTCPPDFRPPDTDGMSEGEAEAALAACRTYDPTADLPALLALPEVGQVTISSFVVGEIDGIFESAVLAGAYIDHDPGGRRANGTGLVVKGRELDPLAPHEFMIGELTTAGLPDEFGVGSRITFTPLLASQGDCASGIECVPGGPAVELELVGVVRTPLDLASTSTSDGSLYLSPALWDTYGGDDFFSYGSSASLWAAEGYDVDDIVRAVEDRWPGRLVQFDPAVAPSVLLLPDTIGLETRAVAAFAAVTALAALVFVGQALARQTRRECHDLAIHATLGLTRRELVDAAAVRALPSAAIAAVFATVAAVALSPIGPAGIARRTIASPSIEVDALVLGVGAAAVFTFVVAASTIPVLRAPMGLLEAGPPRRSSPSTAEGRRNVRLGAAAAAGLRAATAVRQRGAVSLMTAVVGSALAVATVIGAATATRSLDELLARPERYGVVWDVNVGNNGSREDEARSFAALAEVEGVEAAAGIVSIEGSSGDIDLPLVAMAPIDGIAPIDPVVVRGRLPYGPDEIALGATSRKDLDVDIGDHVTFSSAMAPDRSFRALIVGEALINDGFMLEVGTGGVVDAAWARSAYPEAFAQGIAVRLHATADHEVVIGALEERFTHFVSTPEPSYGIRNLTRVRNTPWLLAVVVAMLSVGAFAHALVLSVRTRRRELAVLKVVGFSRRQVLSSVAWQASFVASVALLFGIPIGFVAGRWGWWALARSVGVSTSPAPVLAIALACVAGLLAIVNLVALIPARSAADVRPATVLRSE